MKTKGFTKPFLIIIALLFSALFLVKHNKIFKTEETYKVLEENVYEGAELATSESCFLCHQNTKGYSPHHNPNYIGCASCHLGNTNSPIKEEAHKNMVLIPGNLVDAKQTNQLAFTFSSIRDE